MLQPPKKFMNLFDQVVIYKEPYGVVLIIGPFNYPVQLLLLPLLGAVAAGNCAVIKPSEISAATEKLMYNLIPKYMDNVSCCYFVNHK